VTSPANTPRALIRYALVGLALTVFISWFLYLVRDVLVLLYISALVAIGLGPLVNVIERNRFLMARRRVPRWLAILTIYLAVLTVIAGITLLVVPPLVAQARELWAAFPDLLHRAQLWLISRGLLSRELTVQEAVARTPVGNTDAVGAVIGAITGFVGGIFGFLTILILTFYMLVDGESFVAGFVRLFPRSERTRIREACRSVSTKVSAWLVGQLLLAGTIGSTAALGLYILGVPYFYVLALIAAIGEMIPIVGPVISAVPAVLVALTVSPTLGLAVIIFFLVQQQLENHILVPKIMERQVGVSAVMVITSLLLGGSLLGIVGAILAVPTAAILQVLFYEIWPEAAPDA
jgi:predicted PurR-regulated permease PerM